MNLPVETESVGLASPLGGNGEFIPVVESAVISRYGGNQGTIGELAWLTICDRVFARSEISGGCPKCGRT
jgi:hypothetical protein